jgi:transcriptional regulator with XRE-family HTH domain
MKLTNKEKFFALVSEQDKKSLDAMTWRAENRGWLKNAQAVALKMLQALKSKKMTQKGLAELMEVSPQQVNKWVKGKENFTFETISKIEAVLGITLIEIGVKEAQEIKVEVTIHFQQTIRAIHSTKGNYIKTTQNESKVIPIHGNSVWDKDREYAYN